MNLTAEQITENFNRLISYVDTFINGERKEKLRDMYNKYAERIMFAPASAKEHYHNAFPGGYALHVCNVVTAADKLYDFWQGYGINVSNFTKENVVFCALNHDLGKIGDDTEETYQPNDSEWHRINQGKIYKFNPNLNYMNVSDRTFFLLQLNSIQYNQIEQLGIMLADGMYEEKNKPYLMTYDKEFQLKNNLPILIHHADMMALIMERDIWKAESTSERVGIIQSGKAESFPKKSKSEPQKRNQALKDTFSKNIAHDSANQLFDELFKENKQ